MGARECLRESTLFFRDAFISLTQGPFRGKQEKSLPLLLYKKSKGFQKEVSSFCTTKQAIWLVWEESIKG